MHVSLTVTEKLMTHFCQACFVTSQLFEGSIIHVYFYVGDAIDVNRIPIVNNSTAMCRNAAERSGEKKEIEI